MAVLGLAEAFPHSFILMFVQHSYSLTGFLLWLSQEMYARTVTLYLYASLQYRLHKCINY